MLIFCQIQGHALSILTLTALMLRIKDLDHRERIGAKAVPTSLFGVPLIPPPRAHGRHGANSVSDARLEWWIVTSIEPYAATFAARPRRLVRSCSPTPALDRCERADRSENAHSSVDTVAASANRASAAQRRWRDLRGGRNRPCTRLRRQRYRKSIATIIRPCLTRLPHGAATTVGGALRRERGWWHAGCGAVRRLPARIPS